MDDILEYYKRLGAPGDQSAVIGLLRALQDHFGGSIPESCLPYLARTLGTKESLFLALIRRIPSLRLGEGHLLELCAGVNCGKHAHLLALAGHLAARRPDVTVRTIPCQRLCGKGPNIRWDGTLYHKADEALIQSLLRQK